ncbi:hypothetical protein, partial [Corynebacterium glutamicum]|uniref:hypothetical protein n=1 Tax=Corynebacterium glutamicum TaxID=1718 RepID=UPI001E4F2FD0
ILFKVGRDFCFLVSLGYLGGTLGHWKAVCTFDNKIWAKWWSKSGNLVVESTTGSSVLSEVGE